MSTSIESFVQAIQNGNAEAIKSSLETDPKLVDAKTDQGLSVLLLAMYYRKEEIVNVLLEKKNNFDWFEAAAAGRLDFLKKHLDSYPEKLNEYAIDGFTALGLACFFSKKENVNYLLQKGADPNIASNNNFKVAPLHSAVATGNFEIVKILLENGANVNAAQQNGVTGLHAAAHNGFIEVVKLLLENGADKYAKMEDGTTALDFAKKDNFPEIVAILEK